MNNLATGLLLLSLIALPIFFILAIIDLIKRKSVKKSLFGIIASVFAVLIFSSIQIATTSEEDKKRWAAEDEASKKVVTTEKPTTEKPTTEKPTTEKPTTEKPTTEKPTTEKPTTEKPTMVKAEENNVYGSVGTDYVQDGPFYSNTEGNVKFIGDEDNIFQAEKYFEEGLGLSVELDSSFLINHAYDFMEDDATLIQKISDNEFIYESKKINKKYDVIFSKPDGKTVTRLIVGQHQDQ